MDETDGDPVTLGELKVSALELRERLSSLERDRYGQVWTTTDLLLGLVGDLGDLAKLVQAHDGKRDVKDFDRALTHELGGDDRRVRAGSEDLLPGTVG